MNETIKLNFSAHARVKDIVGRGLIISDEIAIIELIKNSKDAGATSVDIQFRHDQENKSTEIVVADNGYGMTLDDIKYKWLNIAYSEKKNSSPKIGAYAGSKGIGRFSCDRLGSDLVILTKKLRSTPIELKIDWTKFEVDEREREIGKINVYAKELNNKEYKATTHERSMRSGTTLIIKKLRSDWSINRLNSLRKELERFIIDPYKKFSVNFSHWEYDENDAINSPIDNKIFEELDIRASSIEAVIDETGKYISFELRHDGDFLFRSNELNPYPDLNSISLKLFYLNQPAKAYFRRRTGYRSIDYGSVFLFLNSFRVFPYGSAGDDWLGLERRKGQGQRRYFGLRDIVGFIRVTDVSENFEPVSSREGLKRNAAFRQLTADSQTVKSCFDDEVVYGFFHKTMRKLEKFVVDGLDWDRIDRNIGEDNEEELLAGNFQFLEGDKLVLETIDSVVKIRSPRAHIVEIDVNLKYLSQLADQNSQEYDKLVKSLETKFDGTSIDQLEPSDKRDLSRFISRQAKELTKKDETNKELEKKVSKTSKALGVERKKRIFAEFENSADQTRIIQLHHQVGLIAGSLQKRIDRIIRKYREDSDKFTKQQLFKALENSVFELDKIRSVTKLATKADFDLSTNRVREDLVQFISEYLDSFKDIGIGWKLKTSFVNSDEIQLLRTFRPIEVTMLVDNLIDNSGKAGANFITVTISQVEDNVIFDFSDNGEGLSPNLEPIELFEKGITTTAGSGIGLSHAKQIVEDLKGKIEISRQKSGALVRVSFIK